MRLDQREPLGWQRGTGSSFRSGQPPLGRRRTMFNQACEPTSHHGTLIRPDGRAAPRQMSAIFTTFISPPHTHILLLSLPQKPRLKPFFFFTVHMCTQGPSYTHIHRRCLSTCALFGSDRSLQLWLIHCIQAMAGREPGNSRKDEPTTECSKGYDSVMNDRRLAGTNKYNDPKRIVGLIEVKKKKKRKT